MSTAFRSLAPFLRTARSSLKTGHVNPLQSAFKKQNAAGVLNLYRTYAVFERSKPHVNIGTIGHVDHGKVRSSTQLTLPKKPLRLTGIATNRPHSLLPSPSDRPKRALPTSSSMEPLTRLLRSESVVSPSPPLTLSTLPTTDITPTSTALVTPITSRT